MVVPKDQKSLDGWMLRRPLQIECLRQELPPSDKIDDHLHKLQRSRENVDAVVFALSNPDLAADRRLHLLEILRRHQASLESCLSELGVQGRIQNRPPLWYFKQLDSMARQHLAAILGIPEEQTYYEVLDIKAEEYLAQHTAFEAIAEHLGFQECQRLVRNAAKPALALTLSGSLVQISAPMTPAGARRYLYQNIYGNAHPPEGVLVLDKDVRTGHRLRSVELTSSPVRLLRALDRKVSWRAQTQSFERVARTLTSLVSRSTSRLAFAGHLNPQTGMARQVNLEASARVLHEDYGEAYQHYQKMRQLFVEGEESGMRQVEAELLTVCHYLQTAARELGFDTRTLDKVEEFVTEGEKVYRVEGGEAIKVTLLSQSAGPDVVFSSVSVGRQLVTRMAPLAFIGADGGLVEVTLPVLRIKNR